MRSVRLAVVLWAGAVMALGAAGVLLVFFFVDPKGPVTYNTGWLVALVGAVLFSASRSLERRKSEPPRSGV